jgi:hypothetical protein
MKQYVELTGSEAGVISNAIAGVVQLVNNNRDKATVALCDAVNALSTLLTLQEQKNLLLKFSGIIDTFMNEAKENSL